MSVPYSPLVMEHFRRPRHRGALPGATISEEGVNALCGDRVRIELRLDGTVVAEARFTANACALCVASASVLTELATGAPLDEVDTLTLDDLLRTLGGQVPEARRNCVRLPLTVLHTGVMLHRRTHRLPDADRAKPVAAIVLAAGQARRFGAQKLLAPLGESTVIATVVDLVCASGVDFVVGVTGPSGESVRDAVSVPVAWTENPDPGRGMGASVAAGIGALPPNVGAVLVVLGDQPTVSPAVVRRLVESWRLGGGPVVAPSYRGVRGNPVLFDRSLFAHLAALDGEHGARDLIASDPSRVTLVEVAEAPPMDVDTPSDYGELLRRGGPGARQG